MGKAIEIGVSVRQCAVVEKWVLNKAGTPHRLVERCRIMMTKSERSAAPTPRSSIMKPLYVSAFGLLKMTHSAAIASLWIILMSAEGLSNTEQGRRLEVDRQRVRRWRVRWAANEERQGLPPRAKELVMRTWPAYWPRCSRTAVGVA